MATLPIPGMLLSSSLPNVTPLSAPAPLNNTQAPNPAPSYPWSNVHLPAVPGVTQGVNVGSFTDYFRPTRIVTFLVGALLIASGIFALKPVREVARRAARTAAAAGA
jgi:hypothetical protein